MIKALPRVAAASGVAAALDAAPARRPTAARHTHGTHANTNQQTDGQPVRRGLRLGAAQRDQGGDGAVRARAAAADADE